MFPRIRFRIRSRTSVPAAHPIAGEHTASGTLTARLGSHDSNGNPLSYTLTEPPVHGQILLAPDGTFTYLPDPLWAHDHGGTDTFTVRLCRRHWLYGPVSITVPITITRR